MLTFDTDFILATTIKSQKITEIFAKKLYYWIAKSFVVYPRSSFFTMTRLFMKMSGTGKNNFITFLEIGYMVDVVSGPKTAKALARPEQVTCVFCSS